MAQGTILAILFMPSFSCSRGYVVVLGRTRVNSSNPVLVFIF